MENSFKETSKKEQLHLRYEQYAALCRALVDPTKTVSTTYKMEVVDDNCSTKITVDYSANDLTVLITKEQTK